MAYQKLNASRALRIVFSDTIPIPNIATQTADGSATATTVGKLVDSAKDFVTLGIKPGFIIYNTTDTTAALVTAVDSATTLSISADVFVSGETYKIFAEEEKNGCLLKIGDAGAGTKITRVLTSGKDDLKIEGATNGETTGLQVLKVFSTSTTITSAYALW